MKRRPWTPNQVIITTNGDRRIQLAPKRACDRCRNLLGDLNEVELVAAFATRPRPLNPVSSECGLCNGHHVLFAKPEPLEPGQTEVELDFEVLCPGIPAGASALPCASWVECGCTPPAEPLTVEFERFIAAPCPASPTGEHRYMVESERVAAPTGPCWYQVCAGTPDAAAALVTEPGMYPVHVDAFDENTPVFELVGARRDAMANSA